MKLTPKKGGIAIRAVTAGDLFKIKQLSSLTCDPYNKTLVYTQTVADPSKDGYSRSLWEVTEEGEPYLLVLGADKAKYNKEGNQLAFLRPDANGVMQLNILPAHGEPQQVTFFARGVQDFNWSPTRNEMVLRVETTQTEKIAVDDTVRVIETLKYKFNGQGFIYNRRYKLVLFNMDDQTHWDLTDTTYNQSDASFSPTGDEIVFASSRHEGRDDDLGQDIFIVSRDGQETKQITQTIGHAEKPSFSPDGQKIAYVSGSRLRSMPNHRYIWTIDRQGIEQEVISSSFDRTVSGSSPLVWQNDGQSVLALFEDEGRVVLGKVDVQTKQVSILRHGPFQISDFTLSTDQKTLYTIEQSPTCPDEVYEISLVNPDQAKPRTTIHVSWLEEVYLSDLTPYTAQSEDGTEIPCFLMHPYQFQADQSYPGLLKVHGGPYAQYGYSFNHEMQYFVGLGYAVFFSNPRGSSGYSEEWGRVLGQYRGIMDYQDVMAATRTVLKEQSWIDPKRLCVNGSSYGGYMTSWVVGHTDMFKVACSEAAPNNLYSMSGSSDMAGSNHRFVYGFTAQERPDFYMERSPISYAKNVTTPLLIIHSENDLRVSIEQGEQLFVALKLLGQKVRFLRFPGENHGLPRSGKPTRRLYRLKAITEWFAEHLN